MSAPTGKKQPKNSRAPLDDMEPVELMKGMGGNGWFNPGSNDQVAWPMVAESDEEKVPRALYKMHAYMMVHTTTKGNRHPYANKGGLELHLEHMSLALGIPLHNLKAYWRLGVKLGLWRFGTEEEGTKRLYLCAVITPVAEPDLSDREDGDEDSPKQDLYKSCFAAFRPLSPYLRTELEKQPLEIQEQTAIKLERIAAVEKLAHAEYFAAIRMVSTEEQDTLFSGLGINKIRYNGEKKKEQAPEEAAAAAERQGRIDKLLPHARGFVQILEGVVQIQKPTLYESDSKGVQNHSRNGKSTSPAPKSSNGGRLEETEEKPSTLSVLDKAKRASETVGKHQHSQQASTPAPSKPLPTKARSSYTRPEPQTEPEQPRKIDEESQGALKRLAELIEHAQQHYKHTDFGLAEFDPISKSGQLLLLRIVTAIGGPANVEHYWAKVVSNFKGLDKNALGKSPARSPAMPNGPRGLGLLLEWAQDFGRSRAKKAGA